MFAIISELTKPRITIASTLTAAVGYVLARGRIDLNIIPVLIGGFLLAAGSAALNQIQEEDVDIINETIASMEEDMENIAIAIDDSDETSAADPKKEPAENISDMTSEIAEMVTELEEARV